MRPSNLIGAGVRLVLVVHLDDPGWIRALIGLLAAGSPATSRSANAATSPDRIADASTSRTLTPSMSGHEASTRTATTAAAHAPTQPHCLRAANRHQVANVTVCERKCHWSCCVRTNYAE